MQDKTKQLWEEQDQHPGDRHRLSSAVANALVVSAVLYPGAYVDIAPSFVFEDVTYVDTDRRAAKFFADTSGVDEIIAANRTKSGKAEWRFIHADHTTDLDQDGGFDLLRLSTPDSSQRNARRTSSVAGTCSSTRVTVMLRWRPSISATSYRRSCNPEVVRTA